MAHNNPHDFFRNMKTLLTEGEGHTATAKLKNTYNQAAKDANKDGAGAGKKIDDEKKGLTAKDAKKWDKASVKESGADFFRKYSDMIAEAEEADDNKKDAEKDEDESNDAEDKEDKRPEWLKKKDPKKVTESRLITPALVDKISALAEKFMDQHRMEPEDATDAAAEKYGVDPIELAKYQDALYGDGDLFA